MWGETNYPRNIKPTLIVGILRSHSKTFVEEITRRSSENKIYVEESHRVVISFPYLRKKPNRSYLKYRSKFSIGLSGKNIPNQSIMHMSMTKHAKKRIPLSCKLRFSQINMIFLTMPANRKTHLLYLFTLFKNKEN